MGYNYHHIRPQLFSCSSVKLSSVTHRQKKSSNQLSNSQQVNVWVSTLAKHDRHCSSMMSSVCVGGGLYCCFCDTTLFHTCSSREKIYSFSWNLIPSEQSLINLYLPQVGVGLPSPLGATFVLFSFCLHSSVGNRNSMLLFFPLIDILMKWPGQRWQATDSH